MHIDKVVVIYLFQNQKKIFFLVFFSQYTQYLLNICLGNTVYGHTQPQACFSRLKPQWRLLSVSGTSLKWVCLKQSLRVPTFSIKLLKGQTDLGFEAHNQNFRCDKSATITYLEDFRSQSANANIKNCHLLIHTAPALGSFLSVKTISRASFSSQSLMACPASIKWMCSAPQDGKQRIMYRWGLGTEGRLSVQLKQLAFPVQWVWGLVLRGRSPSNPARWQHRRCPVN